MLTARCNNGDAVGGGDGVAKRRLATGDTDPLRVGSGGKLARGLFSPSWVRRAICGRRDSCALCTSRVKCNM